MTLKVLIITNMGPYKKNPYSGLFVRNQVETLKKLFGSFESFDYLDMRPNGEGKVFGVIKYLIFLLKFVKYSISNRGLDIIHTHYYFPTFIYALFYKSFFNKNVRLFCTFHGSDVYKYKTSKNKLYKYLLNYIDVPIFVTDNLKNEFSKKNTSLPFSKVLPVGADLSLFTPFEQSKEKSIDLLYIGTIDNNKNISKAIQTLNLFSDISLNIVIVGTNHLGSRLYESISQSCHNIDYRGPLEHSKIVELLNLSKFTLNYSMNESFGLSITESMAMGVPVIASKTDGSTTQLCHLERKMLFDIYDDEDFVRVIRSAFTMNQTDYIDMSKSCIGIANQFSLSAVVPKLYDLYKESLQQRH